MGLFGGYDTPGPGVSKDEPEKKPFFKFFEVYFRKFWKLMVANALYVLVSLPIVTCGLAETGLAYVTRQFAREKHAFLPSDFFDAIKKNWKQGLIFGILELLITGVVAVALFVYVNWAWNNHGDFITAAIPLAIALFITVMFRFTWYYVYIQIITFKMSFGKILKNSVLFAAGGVKRNFIILLTEALVVGLTVGGIILNEKITLGIVIPGYLLVYPAFRSFLIQFTVFPLVKKSIIDPYYEEHPDEDIEKRRDLNLEIDEEAIAAKSETPMKPAEEPIFTDAPQRERETPVMPKQYGADELLRGKKMRGKNKGPDDDGTI